MTLYRDDAQSALVPLSALHRQILHDLDPDVGGVAWWLDHLDEPRRILIGDYLLGLTHSVEDNLVETVMHVRKLLDAWEQEGKWFRTRLRTRNTFGYNDRWLVPTEEIENCRVEADAHLAAFFRAAGSVMDNLAGLVIGIAGLETDLVRADIRILQLDKSAPRGALAEGDPGRQLQVALVAAVRTAVEAGPRDWLPWLDDR